MADSLWRRLWQALHGAARPADPPASPASVDPTLPPPTSAFGSTPKIKRYGGTIGDLSARLGYDWRDLRMAGYSQKQINGVLEGRYTLDELFKLPPDEKPSR